MLLPGLDGTGLLFRPFLSALPAEIHPTVISYPADETLDLSALATRVLRQLPAGKSLFLAESFSGLVALTLLAEATARVRGVIFVGSFAEPPRPFLLRLASLASGSAALMRSTPAFFLRQFCLGKDATAAQLNLVREGVAAVSPRVLAQRLALVGTRHSFSKAFFDVPACYIRASGDRLVPASCVKWFQKRFRKCELIEIDGPHFLLQAKPRESAEAVSKAIQLLTIR